MGNIEEIKQGICRLDAGTFQNMCDIYLYRKYGYSNIVSLGGEAGTRKTTAGTPDTYIKTTGGKYIFVEYTTKKAGLFKKIKDDISKCVDERKTGILCENIIKIIYCHTSSDLRPEQDKDIRQFAQNSGVEIEVIGIDQLAMDIYLHYPTLANDYLGIQLSTGQIELVDEFMEKYESRTLVASLGIPFLFRKKELREIDNAYSDANVVIVKGAAGVGKTRLALSYIKKFRGSLNEKVFCIHNNGQSIYEDIKRAIDTKGNYFIFIDDADQLAQLKYFPEYSSMNENGYNIRILITVRDYAFKKVIQDLGDSVSYQIISIERFSDSEIQEILNNSFGILNELCCERIIEIAQGNARIAIMTGKILKEENRLDAINDASQIYGLYYEAILQTCGVIENHSLCITIGIIAFLRVLRLDCLEKFLTIIQDNGMNEETFVKNIHILHKNEIVDIYENQVVRFSDQCLSDYILKYIFFDKRVISLSNMIRVCFGVCREKTISAVNTLLNIFINEDVTCFVRDEVRRLWDELEKEENPLLEDFVKAFFRVNPTKTLRILRDKIKNEKCITRKWKDIDTKAGKNYQHVNNEIIELLSGFADTSEFSSACSLFFEYYKKRPDLYIDFYHAVNSNFSINRNSKYSDYITQIIFFKTMQKYSCNWSDELVCGLFFDLISHFLKMEFSVSEFNRGQTMTLYFIPLNLSKGVKEYRKIIWEALITLSSCKADEIKIFLQSYGSCSRRDGIDTSVLKFDLEYISLIVKKIFSINKLADCILINKLVEIFDGKHISCKSIFREYLENESLKIYFLLKGETSWEYIDHEERTKKIKDNIIRYIKKDSFKGIKKIIDVCISISQHTNYSDGIVRGIRLVFECIESNRELYIETIKYYLKSNTPFNLQPYYLVGTMFRLFPAIDVYKVISSEEYDQKNTWLYAYYHELPQKEISELQLQNLYQFLGDSSDKNITEMYGRDVEFLVNYAEWDHQVFVKGCKIIFDKMKYSSFIVNIYLDNLFNQSKDTSERVIARFEGNLELLENIYFFILEYGSTIDYNGQFLKLLYLKNQGVLERYINFLEEKIGEKNIFPDDEWGRISMFFYLDDFLTIYNKMFEALLEIYPLCVMRFLELVLGCEEHLPYLLERQDEWIRLNIQKFFCDKPKMNYLFSVLAKFDNDRKREYFRLFLNENQNLDDFKILPLIPREYSYSGSGIPLYQGWINFLKQLLIDLNGIEWLDHKLYIERRISELEKALKNMEIEELMNS